MNTIPRSLLFVPGDNPERIAKAARSVADAVIVDLEDAVPMEAKDAARAGLADAAALLRNSGKYAIVRVNADGEMHNADIAAVLAHSFDAIMVPKVDTPGSLAHVNQLIDQHASAKLHASLSMIALIESARSVLSAAEIAAVPRVSAVALGSEDFALSMGTKPEPGNLDLPVRMIALAANANGKSAFAMPLSIAAFRDTEAIEGAARLARSYGCHGALCIHPLQVEIVNAAFAPTAEEIGEAQIVLDAWAAAQVEGKGVAVANGKMIDTPVVAWAEGVICRSEMIEPREKTQ